MCVCVCVRERGGGGGGGAGVAYLKPTTRGTHFPWSESTVIRLQLPCCGVLVGNRVTFGYQQEHHPRAGLSVAFDTLQVG